VYDDVPNLADLVRRAAAGAGGRSTALRWQDRSLTWAELDARVNRAAATFAGLEPGDRVAIAVGNVPDFPVAFFGALRAGLVAVPVNPAYTGRELRHVLTDSGAAVVVASSAVLDTIGDQLPATVRRTYPTESDPFAAAEPPADPAPPAAAAAEAATPRGGDDLAVLIYTSGTEGAPKGAMLSHRALLANHEQLAALEPPPLGADDVVLLVLPFSHVYGLNSGLVAIAYHGACGVLVERFDPADTLARIERAGVTVVSGVPPMFSAWSLMEGHLAKAFGGVRLAVCGAAPLDAATARRFADVTGKPLHEGYGLTETAPVVTSTLASPSPKVGSIGRPLPGIEVRLVAGDEIVYDSASEPEDDEDAGSPGSDPGEIVVRGASLFSGYWPDGREGPDPDGWWPTRDVAYADGDGDLFLVDRLSELILVSGFNVYPREVEQVLLAHPGVMDAAAIGIPHPYTGQSVKVFVVRAPGAEFGFDEVIAYCERNLARFKCPTAVEFVPELPRSLIGKVRKVDLE
jgi:long-chain acyl-CoA synthetase